LEFRDHRLTAFLTYIMREGAAQSPTLWRMPRTFECQATKGDRV